MESEMGAPFPRDTMTVGRTPSLSGSYGPSGKSQRRETIFLPDFYFFCHAMKNTNKLLQIEVNRIHCKGIIVISKQLLRQFWDPVNIRLTEEFIDLLRKKTKTTKTGSTGSKEPREAKTEICQSNVPSFHSGIGSYLCYT